jgi:ABC-type dipeptide/oligopeptide/nickel transport system ATPase component
MRTRALEAMKQAELYDVEQLYDKYPHTLSGGMLQRVCIAAAIISEPSLLIADEPTTALDVTTQAHIIALLKRINKEKGTSILFISHNLAVVHALCHKIIVMQKGKIVEHGNVEDVYTNPQHQYTKQLLAAIPRRDKRY